MSVYKIKYELKEGEEIHYRYYRALNKQTAKDMFQETVANGSLIGEHPKIVEVQKKNSKKK
jgi:hypothetical protein